MLTYIQASILRKLHEPSIHQPSAVLFADRDVYTRVIRYNIFALKKIVWWEVYENKPAQNKYVQNIFNTKYSQIMVYKEADAM